MALEVLTLFVDMPVVCNNRCFGSRSAENCGFTVAVHHGRRHLFRCAEAVPLGTDYSADHRDFTVVRIRWSMSLFAGSCPRRGAVAVPMVQTARRTFYSHSCCMRWPMSLLCRSSRFICPSWRRGRFHGPDCPSGHFLPRSTRWSTSLLCRSSRFTSPSGHRGKFHGPETFPYSALLGSTLDTCLRQFTEAFGRFSFVLDPRISAQCLVRLRILAVESPQLQSIKVVDFFFMVHRQISMVLLFSRP